MCYVTLHPIDLKCNKLPTSLSQALRLGMSTLQSRGVTSAHMDVTDVASNYLALVVIAR